MGLRIISFTEKGMRLSERISELWAAGDTAVYTKCSVMKGRESGGRVRFAEEPTAEWTGRQMAEGHTLLFIGACGIAVRSVAPWLRDKLHDSPVLVMDEKEQYVIPILSGHVGGANEIAGRIAEMTGAVPVITTASDVSGGFAVDLFAKKNGLHIVNRNGIAKVSAKVLAGKEVTMSVEPGHIGESFVGGKRTGEKVCSSPTGCEESSLRKDVGQDLDKKINLPQGIRLVSYPPEDFVDIVITGEDRDFETALLLRPREYIIGMGCRRGKEPEKIENLITRSLEETGIAEWQIRALASIDRKKDEEGLLAFSRKARIPFLTYRAEELDQVSGSLHPSDFVKEQTGVDNVCERAALRACEPKGKLVYEKHAADGMTIAIAKRRWEVAFDQEADEKGSKDI